MTVAECFCGAAQSGGEVQREQETDGSRESSSRGGLVWTGGKVQRKQETEDSREIMGKMD
eukprot:366558-Chlamydomonas_euryale.AAC.5